MAQAKTHESSVNMNTVGRAQKLVAQSATPTNDDLAQRAYEHYLARGGEHGRDLDDWLQAERELSASRTS
jgi:hypothetical protein